MRAIFVDDKTTRLYMGEMPDPVPTKDELLVRIKATALNRADLMQRQGLYPPPPGASPVLGLEMAGVVEEVGRNVDGWVKGDRVFALLPGGGYAEKVTIPAGMAMLLPEEFSFEQAAALPEAFLTAYLNLFKLGDLKREDTVLIHAGASGVGLASIQLVRAMGATSIVTAGTDRKLEVCRSYGANETVNYKKESFVDKVNELTKKQGVQLILDFVGASYWEQNLQSLSVDGKLILIGLLGGANVTEVNLSQILFKRLQVIGTALRSKSVEEKIKLTRQFVDFALPSFNDGTLQPVIDSIYSWEDVMEAHQRMENNRNIGKIVLKVT